MILSSEEQMIQDNSCMILGSVGAKLRELIQQNQQGSGPVRNPGSYPSAEIISWGPEWRHNIRDCIQSQQSFGTRMEVKDPGLYPAEAEA